MASLSSIIRRQFQEDIDLIENSLPDLEEGKILMFSRQDRPSKIMTIAMDEYLERCKVSKFDLYSNSALKWSNKLVNILGKENGIEDKLLQKLKIVTNAFDCLFKTFDGMCQKDKDLEDEEEIAFEGAAKNYQEASNTIKAICPKPENSAEITETEIWDINARLQSPQACAIEEAGARRDQKNEPPKHKNLPERELEIFEMEL